MSKLFQKEEWLRKKYWDEEMNTVQMAELAGCHDSTICNWMRYYNIPLRSRSESAKMVCTKEWRVNMSEKTKAAWQEGRITIEITPELRQKRSDILKKAWARKDSGFHKEGRSQRLSEAIQQAWKGGKFDGVNYHTPERIKHCHQIAHLGRSGWTEESNIGFREKMSGDKNPAWVGGTSAQGYPSKFNGKFKKMIRERDRHTCAVCKLWGNCVHHINYVKDDTTPENCITLCRPCHSVTNINREYWEVGLSDIMRKRTEYQCINDYT